MRSINLLAGGEELNPLVPHTAELIVGAIAFTLLFLVLRKAVVPKFEKAFTERTQAIEGGIERAEKAQLEAQRALVQYNEQLHLHRVRQQNFVMTHVFKVLQSSKNFAPRRKKKLLESPLQHMHPLRQSANKPSHHFAMKLVPWLLNSPPRLLGKL
jgi:ATP synthase B/B' CF(0)